MSCFSLVGLIVNMIGVVIVFFNGLPFDVRTCLDTRKSDFQKKERRRLIAEPDFLRLD